MMTKLSTIAKTHAQFRAGELTPSELLEACFTQIDRRESDVQAWVSLDREGAMALAEEQGRLLASRPRVLPPLFGIPIGVKDLFDVAGWPTKAGSTLREKEIANADAPIVTRLREAGAILLGKTHTTQWASFDPSPTHNPWSLDHSPGGSSSGSAAAVTSGMCVAAIGTQTGGSIIRPASYCGCVGFKPEYGRVPIEGVVPLAPTLDHVGGFTRNVPDMALLYSVLTDNRAAAKLSDPPEKIRFGVLRDFFLEEADKESASIFEAVLVHLENNVCEMASAQLPVKIPDVVRWHRTIMAVECAEYHRQDFSNYRDTYQPRVAGLIEEGLAASKAEYADAKEQAKVFRRNVEEVLNQFDVLALPSTVGPAPLMDSTGDPRWQSPWSFAGLPAITIPCGLATLNLPLGLQLVAIDEDKLLAIAAECERELDLADDFQRLLDL